MVVTTIERKEKDGKVRRYKVSDEGTYYNSETPNEVIELLELARKLNYYVWFRLGDMNTGQDWMDDFDTCGFVSRSTGPIKIPILLANRRSMGGGGILTHCIVKLVVNGGGRKRTWQSTVYQKPELLAIYSDDGKDNGLWVVRKLPGKEIVARFKTAAKARRWVDFITGRRLNK